MATQALRDLIAKHTLKDGRTPGLWHGLSLYRFTEPVPRHWDEVASLSLCLVAQGRKVVTIDDEEYRYDPMHYLVMTRATRLQAEVLEASRSRPLYSLVLQIPAPEVGALLLELDMVSEVAEAGPADVPAAYVTPLDEALEDAMVRFLRAQERSSERRVLCPLILKEILFRLLTQNQAGRLMVAAMHENQSSQILHAIKLINERYRGDLDVGGIASAIGMSTSSFAHTFKAVTSVSPIQYLKQVRLERGRQLMVVEGMTASEAAFEVGYSSASYFSNEFKRFFGEPPAAYAARIRDAGMLGLSEAGSA